MNARVLGIRDTPANAFLSELLLQRDVLALQLCLLFERVLLGITPEKSASDGANGS